MPKTTVDIILQELENGELPYEFTYNLEKPPIYDERCVEYNEWTKYEFWLAKQPAGLIEQWPCLEEWVKQIWIENKEKTPLDEMLERQQIKSEKTV